MNLMFDETELELTLDGEGPGAWSILASHSQLSIGNGDSDSVQEFDFVRLPQALPRKTASCMYEALCQGEGSLAANSMSLQADYCCIIITCDQASANIRLLKHVHAVLPEKVYLLPMLCAQHRNGNVIERLTKLLGILPGCYCLSKCSQKGKLFKDWKQAIRTQLQDDLKILPAEPPGVQAEWAAARKQAQLFLELVLEGLADNIDDSSGLRPGTSADIKKFTDFFRGPWTGKDMKPQDVYGAVEKLQSVLCCDTYGGVDAVRYARDAYNKRHPMHLILDLQNGKGGKLWLGGHFADVACLTQNHVAVVFPANRTATNHLQDQAAVRILPFVDGTGVVHKDVALSQVIDRLHSVIELLLKGFSVVILCHNGAHRTVLLLMIICGIPFDTASHHVTQLRNIVDLQSRAPCRGGRINTIRPMDFLAEVSDQVAVTGAMVGNGRGVASSNMLNDLMTPLTLRKMALELGFETRNHIRPSLPSLPVSMVRATGQVKEVRDLLEARSQQIEATRPKARAPAAIKTKAMPAGGRVKAWRFSDSGETGTEFGFTTDDSYDIVSMVGGKGLTDFESDAPKRATLPGAASASGVAPGSRPQSSASDGTEDPDAGALPASLPVSSEAEDDAYYMVDKSQQSASTKMWQDRNPESPVASPRWTSEDFVRLQGVVKDLGDLNRQLMAFTASPDELDEEVEVEVEVEDEPVEEQNVKIEEEAADYGGDTDMEQQESDQAGKGEAEAMEEEHPPTSPVPSEGEEQTKPEPAADDKSMAAASGQVFVDPNMTAAAAVENLVQAVNRLQKAGEKDEGQDPESAETLARLFELLETQKVQQQTLLTRLTKVTNQAEADQRKKEVFEVMYNRDFSRLRHLLCNELPVSELATLRDHQGMSLAHHLVESPFIGGCGNTSIRYAAQLAQGAYAVMVTTVLCCNAPGNGVAEKWLGWALGWASTGSYANMAFGPVAHVVCRAMTVAMLDCLSSMACLACYRLTRAASGSTALHIAASRGQLSFIKKICWSLYHKLGGSSEYGGERSTAAFHMVGACLNSPGGKKGQGVVDMALGNNIECASYLKTTWGGRELLENPRKRGQGYV
ncbi:unnamed protein product [Symbiodinium sp. CCMP2592]|nr:unnamed protein product [Symbiodinium sp. CCMP2592]